MIRKYMITKMRRKGTSWTMKSPPPPGDAV
jgi:hypothetical protein